MTVFVMIFQICGGSAPFRWRQKYLAKKLGDKYVSPLTSQGLQLEQQP